MQCDACNVMLWSSPSSLKQLKWWNVHAKQHVVEPVRPFSCGGWQLGVSMLGKDGCLSWDSFDVKIDNPLLSFNRVSFNCSEDLNPRRRGGPTLVNSLD